MEECYCSNCHCLSSCHVCLQELLDVDMPDLPEYQAPQEQSDISIELQFPSGIADVRCECTCTGIL